MLEYTDRDGNVIMSPSDGRNAIYARGARWRTKSGQNAAFQYDGNLVVYSDEGKPLWASETSGAYMIIDPKGALLICDANGRKLKSFGTTKSADAYLALQQDGNLVLYGGDLTPLWSTGTGSSNRI